jgi:hypothetical protein
MKFFFWYLVRSNDVLKLSLVADFGHIACKVGGNSK